MSEGTLDNTTPSPHELDAPGRSAGAATLLYISFFEEVAICRADSLQVGKVSSLIYTPIRRAKIRRAKIRRAKIRRAKISHARN